MIFPRNVIPIPGAWAVVDAHGNEICVCQQREHADEILKALHLFPTSERPAIVAEAATTLELGEPDGAHALNRP